MRIKDRSLELQKTPNDNDLDINVTNEGTNTNDCNALDDSEHNYSHVIGSGGKLAEFFNDIETISIAIDGVKKSVADVEKKQADILSKPGNQMLQQQLEDLKEDIKKRVNSKIRTKVNM